MTAEKKTKPKLMSLYPLKFDEVIAEVLKVQPEPKAAKPKAKSKK